MIHTAKRTYLSITLAVVTAAAIYTVGMNKPVTASSASISPAVVLTVTKTADTNDGTCNGDCSLREAIATAVAGDTIVFSILFSGPQTITLTLGELMITKNLTILGPGTRLLTISGNNASRVFRIGGAATLVSMSNFTVANGNIGDPGGGIYIDPGLSVNLTRLTVRNNTGTHGGGIVNNGTLNITQSTISSNRGSVQSGGLHNAGIATIINSTFSGNTSANNAGAITDGGQMNLINTTISRNTGNVAGGFFKASGGAVNIRNTIIAANLSGNGDSRSDIFGAFTSQGNNLIGNSSGSTGFTNGSIGDIVGSSASRIDPLLGPQTNNGGSTDTLAPIYPSPVLNAGNSCVTNASCGAVNNPPASMTQDQRGLPRSSGTGVDIGATESEYLTVVSSSDTGAGSLRSMVAVGLGAIITIAPSDGGCSNGVCTINLTSGGLIANGTVSIIGSGARSTIIQRSSAAGTPNFRIFVFFGGGGSVNGVTIRNGRVAQAGGGIAVAQGSEVYLNGVTLKDNASLEGGGAYNGGSLTVNESTINNNTASGAAILTDESFIGSDYYGGGINNNGRLNVRDSTISNNSAADLGGGIYTGESPGAASALNNVTIANNIAPSGGGLYADSQGFIELRNTIVALNNATLANGGPDLDGAMTSRGNNLIGINNGGSAAAFPAGSPNANGDRVGTAAAPLNALLGSLANNGGPTDTRALLAGSPALNTGNNCVVNLSCPNNNPPMALTNDQRGPGFPRQVSGNVDIGAFELAAVADLSVSITDSPDPIFPGGVLTYVITVTNGGTASAQTVGLNAAPPGELTYIPGTLSSSGFGNCAVTSDILNCSAASLAVGAVATAQFQVRLSSTASAGTVLATFPSVTAAADGNPNNNSAAAQTTVHSPVPSATVLSATERGRGTVGFGLGVAGNNFVVGSVVRFNGQNRTTTYVSPSQLNAQIPASDLSNTGTFPITVFNPTPGGGTSNSVNFSVRDCSLGIQISPTVFGAAGGMGNVTVDVVFGCSNWTASVNGNWITGVPAGGSADASFQFTVQPNGGAARVGSIRFEVLTPSGPINHSVAINQAAFAGRTPFDFDGDRKTDIGIFRPTDGTWWINRSSTDVTTAAAFGTATDRIVPADFTGDGKADIAFWQPSTGNWFILRSEDGSFFAFPFGTSGDIPVPADYDNDGKADPAVFRPSNGVWFIQRSSDNGTTIQQFGSNGDVPVAADYDGDGRADLAIFRPADGTWWLNRSTAGVIVYQFGVSSDKLVPGDYTGDGKTDVAFWRPSNGFWFILRSEDSSFYAAPFGTSGDIPAPGDFDGDGKYDVTVFRPSQATWYSQRSTAGTLIRQFGANGDRPVPNAFVP